MSQVELRLVKAQLQQEVASHQQTQIALQQALHQLARAEEHIAQLEATNAQLRQEISDFVQGHYVTSKRSSVEALCKHTKSGWQQNEVLLQTVISNAPVILYALDAQGVFTLTEGKGLQPLGLMPGAAVGQSIFERYCDYPDTLEKIRHVLAGEEREWIMQWQERVYENRAAPLKNEFGQVIGLIGTATDVTECKQAQEALRQSEAQLRLALDAACMSSWDWNIQTGEFNTNNFEQLYGWSANCGQSTYQTFLSSIHPEDQDYIHECNQRAFETGEGCHIEFRIIRADGNIRWIESKGQIFWDDTGTPQRMIGIDLDITERKQTQLALQNSLEFLQTVLDTNPNCIFVKDTEGKVVLANPAFAALYGVTVESLLSKRPTEFHSHTEIEQFVAQDKQVIVTQQQQFVPEEAWCLPTGEVRWFQKIKTPIFDREGQVTQILVVSTDITARKLAEEKLRQSEAQLELRVEERTQELRLANERLKTEIAERQKSEASLRQSEKQFRLVFDEAPIGMVLAHMDYRIFRVNRALCEMLGYDSSELLNRTFADLTHPEDLLQQMPYVEQVIQGKIDSYQLEKRYLKKNREICWIKLYVIILKDDVGASLYVLAMLEDITVRKQAEAEICKALERARELNELRSNFVSMVSHEFRTPLTTIQTSDELLERYGNRFSDEKKLTHHRRIQSAIAQMTQLLDEVLLIGQAEAVKLKFNPQPLDLVVFCRDLIEEMRLVMGSRHAIALTTIGDGSNAQMDEKLLRHILTNLLSNAIKYSPSGGSIKIELVCHSTEAILRIQDWGIGIPEADLDQLFESFRRASNVGTLPGTGLGLAIVKQSVNLHGGQIAVESSVGEGTTFTVTLPLRSESS